MGLFDDLYESLFGDGPKSQESKECEKEFGRAQEEGRQGGGGLELFLNDTIGTVVPSTKQHESRIAGLRQGRQDRMASEEREQESTECMGSSDGGSTSYDSLDDVGIQAIEEDDEEIEGEEEELEDTEDAVDDEPDYDLHNPYDFYNPDYVSEFLEMSHGDKCMELSLIDEGTTLKIVAERDKDADIRYRAALKLADDEVSVYLALYDSEEWVRKDILYAIKDLRKLDFKLHDPDAPRYLIERLLNDVPRSWRELESLRYVGNPYAREIVDTRLRKAWGPPLVRYLLQMLGIYKPE